MPILENCIQHATVKDKRSDRIVTGDLSCDLLPEQATLKKSKQLKMLMKTENLTQLIFEPIRITKHSWTLYSQRILRTKETLES